MEENTNTNEFKAPLKGGGGSKHRALMAALSHAGIRDEKQRHELVFEWTSGRTTSSKEMFETEMDEVIRNLNRTPMSANRELAALQIVKRNKRAAILAIAGRVGFFPENSSNFDYFNGWMVKNSILKKELWKYSVDELDPLMNQFRGIEKHFDDSAKIPGTKAWQIKNGLPGNAKN